MAYDLPLKEMTLREKLAAMESLWEDLTRTPETFESPAWHDEVLEERRRRLSEGKSRFTYWETAKIDLRDKLSSRSRSWTKHSRT